MKVLSPVMEPAEIANATYSGDEVPESAASITSQCSFSRARGLQPSRPLSVLLLICLIRSPHAPAYSFARTGPAHRMNRFPAR